jgi:hypothetical protein
MIEMAIRPETIPFSIGIEHIDDIDQAPGQGHGRLSHPHPVGGRPREHLARSHLASNCFDSPGHSGVLGQVPATGSKPAVLQTK